MRTFNFLVLYFLIAAGCTKTEKVALPANHEPPVVAETNTANAPAAPIKEEQVTQTPQQASLITTPAAAALRVSGQVMSTQSGPTSFKVAGHIAKVFVQEGTKVRKGQLLAQLDDEQVKLSLRSAAVRLEQTKRDMAREEQLKKDTATTEVNYERARQEFQLAQIRYEEVEKSLRDTKLLATYDGVVSKKNRSEGEYVAIGATVFELSSTESLEVNLKMPEAMFHKVKAEQELPVNIPSIKAQAHMKVIRVVPVIDANSRTFTVIGKVTNNVVAIMPGQFVEAEIQ